MRRNSAVAAGLIVVSAACSWFAPPVWEREDDPLPGFPPVVMWAWRRPENLQFIDPAHVGVAFLAATITLDGERTIEEPRMNPLRIPDGTALMAVVRIEAPPFREAALTDGQIDESARVLLRAAKLPEVRALQIDFDAVVSQREFYRRLLERTRRELPEGMPLSITALASWCMGDPWIRGLPVDEAVPMLFRMGNGDKEVRRYLARRPEFSVGLCRASVGLSTDEPWPAIPSGRRIYVFHPRSWLENDAGQVIKKAESWQ